MEIILKLTNVNKSFGPQHVLKDFSLEVKKGEFVVLAGPSGSGKSTILNLVGLLDKADSGNIELFNKPSPSPYSFGAQKLLRYQLGYLFQNYALVDQKSVEYNLMIALENVKNKNKKQAITEALDEVNLSGFQKKKIFQCSGGEQQRVAIARLLLKPCDLILCDEPTGSLDNDNKLLVFELLKKLNAQGKTILVVSHDYDLIDIADRVIYLEHHSN